jgi:lysophospholipase L1-like esterase
MRVLVFGDSIAYGAWDSKGGWVDRLKAKAHEFTLKDQDNNKLQIINLGIGGDTSGKVLHRLEAEIKARTSASWPFTFVFAIGTNDARVVGSEVEVPVESFRKNLQEIIAISQKYTSNILFVGLPPLAVDNIIFKNFSYSDNDVKQYDDVLAQIAQNEGVACIPVRSHFAEQKSECFTEDNLHPNDEGHELILGAVLLEIEKICGVKL